MTDTTDQLIERLQEEYDIDDIDEQGSQIYDYLTKGKLGPHEIDYGWTKSGKHRKEVSNGLSLTGRSKIKNLAVQFGESKRIYNEAGIAESLEQLDELKKETRGLIFNKKNVSDFIDVRKQELQLSLDSQVNEDIENTQSEIESVDSEIEDLVETKQVLQQEAPKEAEKFELTIEEREDARKRLQEKLKELTKKRGRG
ncbi:MAG: hypothetical protein WCX73_05385 [Candidatus Pacearchaeota archaeon]